MGKAVNDIMHNPPHPGRLIKDGYLAPLGMSISEAARLLGITRQGLSYVLHEAGGVSAVMAMRLERLGWGSAETWLSHQALYDLWYAGHRGKPTGYEQLEAQWRQRARERGCDLAAVPIYAYEYDDLAAVPR